MQAWRSACIKGKFNWASALGEGREDEFSDRGSIPLASTKKEVTFVYQKLLLFLSKPQAWYIIAAQSAVHIISPFGAVSHHASACIFPAAWWDATLRVDDMQFRRNWWYTRLRLDYIAKSWYNLYIQTWIRQWRYYYEKNNFHSGYITLLFDAF